MVTLEKVHVSGVRRCVQAHFEVEQPVVVLHGETGAGKTSCLIGIGWGLSGEARTEQGKLSQDQIRNADYNAIAALDLIDEEGEVLRLMRTLTPTRHDLFLDDQKFATIGAATTSLEVRLGGVTVDQLGYLTSAHRLVEMSGLEQADLICGLLGPEINAAWLNEKVGPDLVGALPKAMRGRESGWPMLEDALQNAEGQRKDIGREGKEAAAAEQRQKAVVAEMCKQARCPGPEMLNATLEQHKQKAARLAARQSALEEARNAASAYAREVAEAGQALALAEVQVQAVKAGIAEANTVRAEREAERMAAHEALLVARNVSDDKHAAWQEARGARDRAVAVADALHETLDGLEDAEKCPLCTSKITEETRAQLDETLDTADQARQDAVNAEDVAGAEYEGAKKHEETMLNALADLHEIPADSELQAELQAAVQASDAASAQIEALEGQKPMPAPTPQEVEANTLHLAEAQAHLAGAQRAQEARVTHEKALAEASRLDAQYRQAGALVDRLRELVQEVAGQAIGPVLAQANEMLAPRLVLSYAEGDGVVAAYGETLRPIAELSTGERLEVGVALQASVAVALGVGVCLVDDASVWDPVTAREMYGQMVSVGETLGLTWIVATAQEPPTVEGLQVVTIDGGYSI